MRQPPAGIDSRTPQTGGSIKEVDSTVGVALKPCFVTVAVKVTDWPKVDGLIEEIRVSSLPRCSY